MHMVIRYVHCTHACKQLIIMSGDELYIYALTVVHSQIEV